MIRDVIILSALQILFYTTNKSVNLVDKNELFKAIILAHNISVCWIYYRYDTCNF